MKTDYEDLKNSLDYLKSNPVIEHDPYPVYDPRIDMVLGSLGFDDYFFGKYDNVRDKSIERMNLDDIRVMYSFITRSERFCTGSIEIYVNDGTLLKLLERQMELLNEDKKNL